MTPSYEVTEVTEVTEVPRRRWFRPTWLWLLAAISMAIAVSLAFVSAVWVDRIMEAVGLFMLGIGIICVAAVGLALYFEATR